MTRVRLIIQYAGANYVGWQTQPNGVAVEEVIEKELFRLTGENITLHASGRTDSSVNARAQVAHFDTASRIPPGKFCYALNVSLPADIRIAYSDAPGECFHSRFDVVSKHYRYQVLLSPHLDPFYRDTALHIHHPIDVERMNEAASAILGTHDFLAFKAAGIELKDTVRTISRSQWHEAKASRNGETRLLYYDVAGSGFMYNMVRILVGTMLEIGGGKREAMDMHKALRSRERGLAGATAPAHGLTLYRVEYKNFDTEDYVL